MNEVYAVSYTHLDVYKRQGTARMYLNLFIVFLVSGIWHGAGWNFVLVGALHGALYLITRSWQLKQSRQQCAADVHVQKDVYKRQASYAFCERSVSDRSGNDKADVPGLEWRLVQCFYIYADAGGLCI